MSIRPKSRAGEIKIGGTLDEGGAASYAKEIRTLWGNIPRHIRRSFKQPKEMENLGVKTLRSDALIVQTKKRIVDTLGPWAPKSWQTIPVLYEAVPLAPYKKGQTAAYNYPNLLLPRSISWRIPMNMNVDTVFQTSDRTHELRMLPINFFIRLQDKVTVLICFSGQPLSGLWTGVEQWRSFWEGLPESKRETTQMFRMHIAEGWFSRRSHMFTKFALRRQVEEEDLFSTLVYRDKWTPEIARTMHVYNQDLPSILLIDKLGYIRWHAVGLPTEDAMNTMKPLIKQLLVERRG